MKSKVAGAMLVLLGFACWLVASSVVPESSEWFFVVTYFVAGFAFFLVGCFLPEYQDRRSFLGRRSALQLMAFFFWLAVNALGRIQMFKDMSESLSQIATIQVIASLGIAFGSYFIATYLIRGFRAHPDYAAFEDPQQTEQVADGKPVTRPS